MTPQSVRVMLLRVMPLRVMPLRVMLLRFMPLMVMPLRSMRKVYNGYLVCDMISSSSSFDKK